MMIKPLLQVKRKIFVSYHHGADRQYYLEFKLKFSDTYDVVHDNSVERVINSSDADYVIRKIREKYISGSSCTVVLCGADTPFRKFVDWEIKATLDKEHGLIGVYLPTKQKKTLPSRLYDNKDYAELVDWDDLIQSTKRVQHCIEIANSKQVSLIDNSHALRQRNGF